jgi:hypothetical protein
MEAKDSLSVATEEDSPIINLTDKDGRETQFTYDKVRCLWTAAPYDSFGSPFVCGCGSCMAWYVRVQCLHDAP